MAKTFDVLVPLDSDASKNTYDPDYVPEIASAFSVDKSDRRCTHMIHHTWWLVHGIIARILKSSRDEYEVYSSLQSVPPEHDTQPALAISHFSERIEELTNIPVRQALPYFWRLTPEQIFSFSDEELAMMIFSRPSGYHTPMISDFLHQRFFLLMKLREKAWETVSCEKKESWNETIRLLQSMIAFEFAPFEVRIDFSRSQWKWHGEYLKDNFHDGSIGFHLYYKEKRVLVISFCHMGENKIYINQIQGAQGVRKELSLIKNYPSDILHAFLEAFSSYEVYLIDGERVTQNVIKTYGDQVDKITQFIEKDSERVRRFYNQSFSDIKTWESKNGYRRLEKMERD